MSTGEGERETGRTVVQCATAANSHVFSIDEILGDFFALLLEIARSLAAVAFACLHPKWGDWDVGCTYVIRIIALSVRRIR